MKNKFRKYLALLLTVLMLASCMPVDALAATVPVSGGTQTSSGISLRSIVRPPVATATYIFMNGNEEFARQIVKDGETLNNPGTPDAGSPNREFTGWRDGDNNAPVFGAVTVTEPTETTYRAQFADVYFVFFTNPNGEVMVTKKGYKGDTISTEGVTYPVGNEQSIVGWKDKGGNTVTSVTLTDHDVTLTADVVSGHWITYDSQGGSYVAPAFVKGNGATTAPAVPTRPGYTFRHWSAAVGGAAFTFGQPLDQALTLYAVWTANANTRYTVIHWLENADDNEYSYRESETRTGATGAQTSAAAKSYTGFTAQDITQQTIAGDGSTIVSVYYKRNVYNVRFYNRKGTSEYTQYKITAKYGANIRDKWPTHNGSSSWFVATSGGTAQVGIDTMPLNGAKFYGPQTGYGTSTAYYYVQVLPGESGETTVSGVTYKLHHKDTSPGGNYSVTVEDQYPITGFTFNSSPSTSIGGDYNNAKFYYTRNSYNIVYVSGGQTVNTASKKFEESIADAGSYTPTVKPAGMEDYDFGGWHADPAGGQAYTFTGKTMPAQNVTVYAKWNKPVYNGTIYLTIEGTTGSSITLNVPKGDTIETALNEKQAEIMAQVGEGYTWRGWRTGKDGTGEPFNPKTQITTDVTLYPYYTKDGTFKVEYVAVKDDVTAPVDDKSYAEDSFAGLKSPGKLVADDGEYFLGWSDGAATYQPRDKYQIKSNHANEQNVITLTAQWGARPAGTTLTYKANGGTGEDVVENLANNATVTTIENPFTRTGYTFVGWDTSANGTGSIKAGTDVVQVDNGDGANVLYAIWTADKDTKYTVEFYYQNVDGTYTLNHSDERTATTDTEVSVTENDKLPQADGKYVFDESNKNNVLSGVVAGDGSLVLKLYFKLNTASYTIHHYLNGTTVKVADDQTGAKTIGETLTANKSDALYAAYAAAVVASYAPSQTITIAADESENVITVYYTVPLTITAGNAEKTYDGQPLTQPDFTMEGLVNGDTKDNFSLSMTAASTITNAGNTPNVIDTDTVKYKGGEIPSYYNVSYKPGTLTVNKAAATVTITGVNETAVYDGTQHEANGYNYSFTGKPGQITISLKPNVLAIARRTDVGTTYMGLTKDSFTVTSANYDVTIKAVIDGYVTITPVTDKVTVTVTENGDIVTYDGNEHSVKGYKSMTADNALYDVTKSVKATETDAWTAKGTDAGEYPVGIVAGDFVNTNTNFTNVEFVIVDGALTINPVTDKVTVTVTENSATYTYDGTEHSVKGYKSMTADNELYDVTTSVKATETAAWTAKGTNVGEYPVGIVARDFVNTNKNFTNVEFVIVDGALTINPITDKVTVTITENSATYTYDGNEHSVKGYKSMTADNELYDVTTSVKETETAAWTAKGTEAGEYPVGVAAGDFENINKNFTNVAFVIVDGVLKINPITENTITITANSKDKTYDGTPLTDGGFTFTPGVLVEGDVLTAVVEGSATNVGDEGKNVVKSYVVKRNGVDVTANYTFNNSVDGELTITKRSVKLTSATDSKEYDGTPLTKPDVTVGGDGFVTGEVTDMKATGSVTFVSEGTVDNTISYTTGASFNEDNYTITKEEGKLSITPRAEVIVITTPSRTREYNGEKLVDYQTTHTGTIVEGDRLVVLFPADAGLTDVGTKRNEYASYYVERISDGKIVTDNYTFGEPIIGTLEVTPVAIELTANSASKEYDGTPLIDGGYKITKGAFVTRRERIDGKFVDVPEGLASVTVVGSQTLIGSSDNTITGHELNKDTQAKNYTITYVDGRLTVTGDSEIIPEKTTPDVAEDFEYKLGDTIPFTITVQNVSAEPVENIVVEDKTAIIVAGAGYTVSADGHTATIASLAPGAQVEISAEHVVTEDDILVNVVENTATVDWKNNDKTMEVKATTDHIEDPNSALEVDKETTSKPKNGETYALGEEIKYTITVTNTGNLTATEIKVTDSLSKDEGKVIGTIASLAPGDFKEFPFTYTVTEDDILNGKVLNVATAKGKTPDPDGKDPEGGGSTEDETDDIDTTLEVVKTSNKQPGETAKLGEVIEYTITVTNKGNVSYTNVKVDDELTGLHKTIAKLGVGENKKFTTEWTVTEDDILNGKVLNVATAKGDKVPDPKDPENPKTPEGEGKKEDGTEEKKSSFTVVKTLTNLPEKEYFTLGETAEFDITVTNDGNLTLTDLTVTEQLSGAKYAESNAYTVNGADVIIAELKPGEQVVIKASYTITEDDLGNKDLKNVVTGKGKGPDGKDPEGGDEEEVPTDEAVSVSGSKTWDDQDNRFEVRPETITLRLYAGDSDVVYKTAEIGADQNWTYKFSKLPKHTESGDTIAYTVKEVLVDGYETTTVETDSGVNFTNTLRQCTLHIDYTYIRHKGGTPHEAFPPVDMVLYYGQEYSVKSPKLWGYVPNIPLVEGVITEDTVVHVLYTGLDYTLTIEYVYEDGTTAAPTHTEVLKIYDKYGVASPKIPGYVPTWEFVAGKMYAHDEYYRIVYRAIKPQGIGNITLNLGDCFE